MDLSYGTVIVKSDPHLISVIDYLLDEAIPTV